MKKIIIVLCIFLLTGCYDYVEINDLSFVSCIGIDYQDDNFSLTYEILNDTKTGSEQASQKGYTITEEGSSIAQAFDNISLKIAKKPYFYHLKSIVISEDVGKYHMKELIEYVTRDPEIRNGFYLVIAKDVSAKDVVENSSESNPVVGNQITKLIDSNVKGYNITYAKPFEDVLEMFLNSKIDPITSAITLQDKEITAVGIAIYNDYCYEKTLSKENSAYLNLLRNENANFLKTKKIKNQKVVINISDAKTEYEFKDKTIEINISLEGEIRENLPNLDFREEETYLLLAETFSKDMTEDITILLKEATAENLDIAGFENMYYKKYRKENKSILKHYAIKVNVDLEINKKGLIFEVTNE